MTARRFRPARPVAVRACPAGAAPAAFRYRGRLERVALVEADWLVEDGWWRGAAGGRRRHYYRLRTRAGGWYVLYRDLAAGDWYLEEVLD